ncbi:hypothetical protein [Streptacidiphilus neutrinimicus]|uniref:hypothetical protein n=1 Tax=Streptacidiphilus neutrinimicus TaxID=105420 RepID=UPI000693D9BE|nr:hypothetical protein [Streptacidiphilus neutrinimicus]
MNHRRPNPDELTPDDLFRPADGGPTAAYGAPLPAPEAQPAATQYLPPMPAAPAQEPQPYGAQPGYAARTQPFQGFPQQQTQQAAYGASYEQTQPYERAPYEPSHFEQPQYEQPQYEQSPYDQGGYEPYDDHGYDDGPHRNRPSMRTLGIAVVAGCAVLGIGLGALLSGGSSASASADKGGATAKHGATAGPGPGDKTAQLAQATALSALLDTASSNRTAVVNAVASVQACQTLPQDQATLTSAAQDRLSLITKLGQLQVSALPSGTELVAKLTAGWQASQQADSHYAAWAAESAPICQKKHHPKEGGESTAAVSASSNATLAKRDAAALWNKIASANNLPTKEPGQL